MINTRQQGILEVLKKGKNIKVTELATIFDVSEVTIRKDIIALEEEGFVNKFHGKVSLAETGPLPYKMRSNVNTAKKRAIAKVAADIIKEVQSITLDSGSTTSMIAEEIVDNLPMSIVTNSLMAVNILTGSRHVVSIAGGMLSNSFMCIVGPDTEEYLEKVKTEYAFIGCTGVRGNEGLCTGMRLEANVKRALMKTGEKVIAVLDDNKFNAVSMYQFADFSEIDMLITTHGADDSAAMKRIKDLGIQVIYADDKYPLT